jgi:2,5-furandicarboxylate decarboxylase 1
MSSAKKSARTGGEVATPVATLRGWLDRLSQTGRLAAIRPGVSLKFELAAIAKKLDGTKATVFPKPGGHSMTVISGLVSSRNWIAEAMGVSTARLLARFQEAARSPIPWREVKSAPVQEVVHKDIDLLRLLPVPTHNELDSGAYLTAGLLISRNPQTGRQNVAIHRHQISGPASVGALLLPRHTLAYQHMAEQAGEDLPIAIVIGVDPLTLLSSQAIAPLDQDELEIAGALHGAPLEVVKCMTNEVRVPAHAEIVLEGRILARSRAPEGPFGEFPQYYGERAERHVIAIDLVTHRPQPLFHTIVGGGLEHLTLGGIPREATILDWLQRSFPSVKDVHLALGGTCRYHLYIKMKKRFEGEAKNVIAGAFAAHYDIKHVIAVDEDVDIHNPQDVEWAIATRFQADRDFVILPNSMGSKLDPSTSDGIGAKMGLDATVPLNAPEGKFRRIRVPGEDSVDLDSVVTGSDWRSAIGSRE